MNPIKTSSSRLFKTATLLTPILVAAIMAVPTKSYAQHNPSPTITGALGLNSVPSARMDTTGTMRAGLGFSDIYTHGFIGMQVAEPLSITLRQSAETSSPLNKEADRFFPGIDTKIRLNKESSFLPAIAIGLQSATGHTRMSGEYIALSKRYKSFDLTAGLGWGRYGSSFTLDNPLKSISNHFGHPRALDGEMPVQPDDWFTGDKIGVFGGIEYFTPVQGLSLKADFGADRFEAEKTALQYDTTAPWTLGTNYRFDSKFAAINAGLAAHGRDRIMARLSISQNINKWKNRDKSAAQNHKPLTPNRSNSAPNSRHIETQAKRDKITLQQTTISNEILQSTLSLSPHQNTPQQIRNVAVQIANNAGPDIEKITITPGFLGLQGHPISIMRKDLENALAHTNGSAEEIWQNTHITTNTDLPLTKRSRINEINNGFLPFSLTLDNQFSFAEEDYGALHRTSLIAKALLPRKTGYLDYGAALRLNIADNLTHLEDFRPTAILPVRSNVLDFAKSTIGLDEAFIAFTHSPRSDLHISALYGYLEEMYGGLGGEILYRPLNQRFTLGAETYLAFKRDPDTFLTLGFNGDSLLTGHINASYDIPQHDINLTTKIGRFLAEDFGAQIGFKKHFQNGAQLDGYITISDTADLDLFGGTTHADHGLRLKLPLGSIKYMPEYAGAQITAKPFGRDSGQSINNPLPLYDLTEPFSLPHITRHWSDITPLNIPQQKNSRSQ